MGADNSKPSQVKVLIGLFGHQLKVGSDYIWADFRGRTLLGSPVIFSKIMWHDDKVWVFLPLKADAAKVATLDPRINYNRTTGELYTIDADFATAISLIRSAIRSLRNMPPSPVSSGDPAVARGDYADLVQMVKPELFRTGAGPHGGGDVMRERYQSFDDGHASNMPGALISRANRDALFYDGLQQYGDFPFVQRPVSTPRSADRIINSGRELMSTLTETVSGQDDEHDYEANYQQSGNMFAAQLLSEAYPGPIVATNANFDPVNNRSSNVASVNGVRTAWPAAYVAAPATEHFQSNDVRFQPLSAFIYYDIGSDTNSIDRTYGTVPNGVRFPAMTDVLAGWTTTRPLPVVVSDPNISTNFQPPPTERFSSDPFLEQGIPGRPNNMASDPFLQRNNFGWASRPVGGRTERFSSDPFLQEGALGGE